MHRGRQILTRIKQRTIFFFNPFVLLLTVIGLIFPSVLPYRACFPFHNYRQVHVFQNALTAGWNEGFVAKGIVPKIPDCPALWQDVRHYWNFGCLIGTIAYETASNVRFIIALLAVLYLKVSSGATLADIAEMLVKVFPLGI